MHLISVYAVQKLQAMGYESYLRHPIRLANKIWLIDWLIVKPTGTASQGRAKCIVRSTSKSRPNNIGGKMSVRPYVRTSVRPQKSFFDLNEIWYIGRGRWVMHDGPSTVCRMAGSKVKVKVTSPSKFEFLPFSKPISSAIYNGSCQITTNS